MRFFLKETCNLCDGDACRCTTVNVTSPFCVDHMFWFFPYQQETIPISEWRGRWVGVDVCFVALLWYVCSRSLSKLPLSLEVPHFWTTSVSLSLFFFLSWNDLSPGLFRLNLIFLNCGLNICSVLVIVALQMCRLSVFHYPVQRMKVLLAWLFATFIVYPTSMRQLVWECKWFELLLIIPNQL